MQTLSAAVIGLSALVLAQLLLTFGVIRRLREHHGQLASLLEMRTTRGPVRGDTVAEFDTVSVDGAPVSSRQVEDDTLVAFISIDCAPCEQLRPELRERAAAHPRGRDGVVVVVVPAFQDTEHITPRSEWSTATHDVIAELTEVATVVVELPTGADPTDAAGTATSLSAAFGVSNYPTLCLVGRDLRIVASAHSFTQLSTMALA